MANNFITNNANEQTIKDRLNTLISVSDEMKFLVGFFYFSGWREICESIMVNPHQKIKILIGLRVCNILGKAVEYSYDNGEVLSRDEEFEKYIESLGFALNNDDMDKEAPYNQWELFINLMHEGRLIIRKTENPNHAKLYLFQLNKEQTKVQNVKGSYITGSSNLTKAGLSNQEEFNVEMSGLTYPQAEKYFDDLWEKAIPITENIDYRTALLDFIQSRTQIAAVTPFEAYCLIIKTYLELQQPQEEEIDMDRLLKKVHLKKFSYQADAVNQALQIIKEHNGCIIADVVGLGKSVIASMIARQMNKRGIIICPPALMGDPAKRDSGWWEYLEKFDLYNWHVYSRGVVDRIKDDIDGRDFDVVIIDEAHYFRNEDTADYEALSMLCRGKQVILLTATPFNNSPSDIFTLLKLFVIPGKSTISLEDNIQGKFSHFNFRYKQLSFLFKNWNSKEDDKRQRAEEIYVSTLGEELPISIKAVKFHTKKLSDEIKRTISPVVIRRNRLDLLADHVYSKEVGSLSTVKDPEEIYYYLDKDQDAFYDEIIGLYFGESGRFKGAIYQPFSYEKLIDESKLDQLGNRQYNQQKNLYGFMRRLLVKRFESSFGSFAKSIDRFLRSHRNALEFIKKTGKFILDKSLLDKIKDLDIEEIDSQLEFYQEGNLSQRKPKNIEVYDIENFQRRDEFIRDIENDISIFEIVLHRLKALELVKKDPKQKAIIDRIKDQLAKEPDRKIILFSEYVDTISHLEKIFREEFGNSVLICDGKISKELAKHLNSDFNAQYKGIRANNFKILLTSDKLSEGFNLNRAGLIINYDIPWNPTRVIQRVGRINRIGMKVFDELYIYNFFPSVKGADIVKSREIAQQKMFLIHNALGEDAKIFDADEEPSASALRTKLSKSPENDEEVNTITKIRNLYAELEKKYPDLIDKISKLPPRVKTAKSYNEYQLNVLRRKGLSLFAQTISNKENKQIKEIDFEQLLDHVSCNFEEPTLKLSSAFWGLYEEMKDFKPKYKIGRSEISLEEKAKANLKSALKLAHSFNQADFDFLKTLLRDINEYYTLPIASIRRLANKEVTNDKKSIQSFKEEIHWLKKQLGEDYLTRIEQSTKEKSKEVIISVENQDGSRLF